MISCIETAPGEFALAGRVDVHTVADLRVALQKAVDAAAPLAAVPGAVMRIDVAELEFVDAAGLGVLVSTHRRAGRAGLGFSLRNVPDPLARLLFISRLYRVLSVEKPQIELLRELTPRPRTAAADLHPEAGFGSSDAIVA